MNTQKINYQKELDNLIEKIKADGSIPRLLLHSCCGPCSSYCLSYLHEYFDITVFFYNPNIYPIEEYYHRLSEQERLIAELNKEFDRKIKLIDLPYDHSEFTDFVKGLENEKEGGARCSKCFELRLLKAHELANELKMDYFGTTLTVSPHKNAVLLNAIGNTMASDSASMWLPSDFKKKEGYKQSVELSKKYELYRQNYCGCEFSIWF